VAGTGPLTLPLILLALALAWAYSAPPWRLNWRGLGEVTVAIIVPGLTTLLGYYLQAGRLAWLPVLTILPLMGLQFGMSLTINFPDAAGDTAAGKRTLVVRLGGEQAVRVWGVVQAGVYLSLPALWSAGLPAPLALAMLVLLPVSLVQGWRLRRGAWRRPASWDSLSFWAIGLLVGTAGLAFLGALWLAGS
jgi:1,4-dihydroxy-2-naphthoate octaprenyltransferase